MTSALVLLTVEHYITIGGLIAPTVTVVVGAITTAWIQRLSARVKTATHAAETAARQTEPTGNGFAQEVTAALQRIERRQVLTDETVAAVRRDLQDHLREDPTP